MLYNQTMQSMPKFIYSIYLFMVLSWAAVFFMILNTKPESPLPIVLMLLFLFFALGFTFSIPVFIGYKKLHPTFTDQRSLYRKGFKWGFYLAFGVVGIAFLKAFELLQPLNVVLFVLFYAILSVQLKGR
jgi:hypothetical protein